MQIIPSALPKWHHVDVVDAVTLKAEELEGIYRTTRDLSGNCC